MGDSSVSNMETDVSSTTGDVPDSQQVTGSQSNMEIVEVDLEQLEEGGLNSSDAGKPSGDVEVPENEPNTTETSPKNSIADCKNSPVKITVSPNLERAKLNSPTKKESSPAPSNKPDVQTKTIQEQQSETVDSSSNIDLQASSDNNKMEVEANEGPKKKDESPIKGLSEPEQSSPTKEVVSLGSTDENKSTTGEEKQIVNDKVDSTDCSKQEETKEMSKTPIPADICNEIEASNDSQMDASSDLSEKEHNKSISRELKYLIKSAKESKIIYECTQVTTKMRKSRTPLDTSSTALNTSVDAEKIQGQRRVSSNSQQSTSSEASEKVMKRSMRSQNPEFVFKVKQFLNSVTGKVQKETEAGTHSDEESPPKSTQPQIQVANITPKLKKMTEELNTGNGRLRSDPFCWRCHWCVEQESNDKVHNPMHCTVCPRSFDYKCLSLTERSKITTESNWVCPECRLIMQAESSESRSPAMKKISLGMLCELLAYTLERMKDLNGVEPFDQPVDRTVFPDYDKYVVHPMDLSLLGKNIKDGHYGSTEAFYAEAQWILHNSVIFNSFCNVKVQSKLTASARALLRLCKTELGEIEVCPECYSRAHARKPTWFIEVCSTPHILLWAKLKGFPYWPAKGMSVNSSGLVDVRFFGAHDRAWVPSRDCFLYSEKDPNNFRAKRQDIIDSMQEAEQHIRNISRKYGKYVYPPFRTQFEPSNLIEQLKIMIPAYEPDSSVGASAKLATASPNPVKRFKLSSKSPKNSSNDGETSEKEASSPQQPTDKSVTENMDTSKDKDVAVTQDTSTPVPSKKRRKSAPQNTQNAAKDDEKTRKRRRSQLEEAVITIIETEPPEKRKKIEDKTNKDKKTDTPDTKKTIHTDKQKTTENGSSTPKSKPAKESPSVKKSVVTYVSRTPKINPLKIVISTKAKTPKSSTPKSTPDKAAKKEKNKSTDSDKEKEKQDTPKPKQKKSKSVDEATKSDPKTYKPNTPKHSGKGICVPVRIISKPAITNQTNSERKTDSNTTDPKTKDKVDDDTSLADLARGSAKNLGMPTISCVRSLSSPVPSDKTPKNSSQTIEITVEAASNSSVFTPTSTDSVKTSKEAANKLQRLRAKEPEPSSLIGKVGVRAFARMTSPPASEVQVEVKSEPIDLDLDADRQSEKMDLMNAFRLRPVVPPVNPIVSNLRDVRITKVLTSAQANNANAKKLAVKSTTELRPRAKKSFPLPKKPEEGRSELNSKNSMVYIPIQPPTPVRPQRPAALNGPVTTTARSLGSTNTMVSSVNTNVNTLTTPLVPSSISSLPVSSSTSVVPSHNLLSTTPTIGQVPTNVHTVPLLTTMNGQWTISLQPIMSVGGVDTMSSPPLVNGVPDRSGPAQSLVPIAPTLLPNNQTLLTTNQNLLSTNVTNQNLLSNAVTNQNILQAAGINPMIAPNVMRTDNVPGEMCRIPRPIVLNPQDVPPSSSAGPITAKINNNAAKLTDLFRTLLEDAIDKVDDPTATVTALKLQLEHVNWKHKQEIDELKHTNELQIAEMRLSLEKEKSRCLAELKRSMQTELDTAKLKQWCAQCRKEAQFYCCWNAAYCDESCQRAHWRTHYSDCEQTNNKTSNSNEISSEPESRLQRKPITQKTPMLTVGGKVVNQEKTNSQKSAIIMSMVEDPSGTQSMKCVGYQHMKQPAPPLLINKQLMANDESKKVVTSGGYLIVGTGAPNSPLVTQTLRPFYST